MPKQNAPADHPPVPREEPIERPELEQPVAYIAGRYVYGHASGNAPDGQRRGLYGRHRTRAA